mgnify:FL=1
MIALLASAVGNVIVKSPAVLVLSPPKAKVQTDVSPDVSSLNISAPFAVIVLLEKVTSAKSVNAVVLLVLGSTRVSVAPFAVYPVPDTSLDVEYAVVLAPKDAELVYSAILKVSPPEFKKLCFASISSFLKLVHIAVDIAIRSS